MHELPYEGSFADLCFHPQVSERLVKQVSIQRLLIATITAVGCLCFGVCARSDSYPVPADLSYEVWMDDKPLGTHDYRFSQHSTGELLQVESNARFNVKVLFVNLFSYDHSARELWKGSCLSAVRSKTTTNGKIENLDLEFDGDACHGTYSYWDSHRLQRSTLTNAQTGEQESAQWARLESVPLPIPNRKVKLSRVPEDIAHYQLLTQSARFLLWYGPDGRNLAMQTTNDGRTITYVNRALR